MKEIYQISKINNTSTENIEIQNFVAITSLFCIGEMMETNNEQNIKQAYNDAVYLLNLKKLDNDSNYKTIIQISNNFINNYYNRGE
ncbi:MAG: hypothetical protein IKO49_04925 [Bacilli bacterium]|nr:hypothetical protein [Bacilli bacterium]